MKSILFLQTLTTFISKKWKKLSCEKEISIPMDTINVICKLLKDSEKEVIIGFSGENIILTWENAYFSSKTIAFLFLISKVYLPTVL